MATKRGNFNRGNSGEGPLKRLGRPAGGSVSPPRSDKLPLSPRRAGTARGIGTTNVKTGRTNVNNPTGPLSRGSR